MPSKKKTSKPILDHAALALVAARFRALGDPSRLHLLNLLMQGEASVNELVDLSGLSQANVSRHLGLLRRDGLVARSRDGNRAFYRISDPNVSELCRLVCGGISEQLYEGLDALQRANI
jgi:ArsR family transcriptional regulator